MDRERSRSFRPSDRGQYLSRTVRAAPPAAPLAPLGPVAAPETPPKTRAVKDITSKAKRFLGKLNGLQSLNWKPRTFKQRFIAGNLAFLILAGLFVQILDPITAGRSYALSPQVKKLIGESRDDAGKYLALNEDKTAYTFEVPNESAGAGAHGGRNASVYSTNVSLDASKGITYTDAKTKVSITVTPEFGTARGEKVDNSIVYPSGADKLIYTHKFNGLKEDIIVPSYRKDDLKYGFKLALPVGAEARLDKQGNIGIYSGDQALYGDIKFGSDEDEISLDKAREKSKKTNLIATIPYPIVKDASGKEYGDRATFSLSGKTVKKTDPPKDVPAEVAKQLASKNRSNVYDLTITTKNIKALPYPISVDPTIQASSASDFYKGNFDGVNTDETNNLIRRNGLTGGSVGSWTTSATTTTDIGVQSTNFYNNKLYVENPGAPISFASINPTTGDIGSFTSTGRNAVTGSSTIHNGFYYSLYGGAANNITYYAKINADGTLGTFTQSPVVSAIREGTSKRIYGGYIYSVAGYTRTGSGGFLDPFVDTYISEVQYSKLNADGSLGAFSTTSSVLSARAHAVLHASNGYVYITGGVNGTSAISIVEYAAVNPDGSLSAWRSTTSLPLNSFAHGAFITNGYMYFLGGYTGATSSDRASVYYAQVNSDGSLGAWTATTSFTTARRSAGFNTYNGYLYIFGGTSGETPQTNYNDIQYAKINPAGSLTPTTNISLPAGRGFAAAATYNGYLYLAGGCTNGLCSAANAVSSIIYAPITETGLGGWSTATTTLPALNGNSAGRQGLSMYVFNDKLVIVGGTAYNILTSIAAVTGDVASVPITTGGNITGSWTTSGSLNTARDRFGSAYLNGYLYVYAGRITTANTNKTEYAAVSSTGTVGSWTDTSDYPAVLGGVAGTADPRGYIYGFAGNTGSDNTGVTSVYYAKPSVNGSIPASGAGAWTATSSMPNITSNSSAVFDRGYVYLSGGQQNNNNAVVSVRVNPDGSLPNQWITNATLTSIRQNAASIAINGALYICGGTASSTPSTDCNYSQINNGGSGAPRGWTTAGNSMPGPRSNDNQTLVYYKGFLYWSGGATTGNASTTNIFSASLSNAGDVGPWTIAAAIPSGADREGALVAENDRLYYANATASCSPNVYMTTINSNGTLNGTWTAASTVNIPGFTCKVKAFTYHGRYYVYGGWSGGTGCTVTVSYATINPANGTLGAWTTSASSTTARRGEPVVYGGYLYVIGGWESQCTGSGNDFSAIVESATIDADGNGSIGTFTPTTSLLQRHGRGRSLAIDGYMYSVGGQHQGASSTPTTTRAPILSGGKLGNWEQGIASLNTSRVDFSLVTDGRKIVIAGGNDLGANYYSSVETTSLQSIPRKGSYSRTLDFDRGVLPTKLITRGTGLSSSRLDLDYITSNNTSAILDNSGGGTNVGYGAGNAYTMSVGSGRSVSRYLHLRYTLDDTSAATFPDVDAGQSTITDYDLYFTANPGSRLRGGQTFVGGQDRGLQTTR